MSCWTCFEDAGISGGLPRWIMDVAPPWISNPPMHSGKIRGDQMLAYSWPSSSCTAGITPKFGGVTLTSRPRQKNIKPAGYYHPCHVKNGVNQPALLRNGAAWPPPAKDLSAPRKGIVGIIGTYGINGIIGIYQYWSMVPVVLAMQDEAKPTLDARWIHHEVWLETFVCERRESVHSNSLSSPSNVWPSNPMTMETARGWKLTNF